MPTLGKEKREAFSHSHTHTRTDTHTHAPQAATICTPDCNPIYIYIAALLDDVRVPLPPQPPRHRRPPARRPVHISRAIPSKWSHSKYGWGRLISRAVVTGAMASMAGVD
eukprot:scaffold71142_cov75-Phaeocystis_antarctica.AAC.1